MRMKTARKECGLTQEQLAEKAGIGHNTVCLIETGQFNPSLRVCIDICLALNKTLNDLFWNAEQ